MVMPSSIETLTHNTTIEIRHVDRNDRGYIDAVFAVTYDPAYEETPNIVYWCIYKKVGGKLSSVETHGSDLLPSWIVLG